MVNPWNMVPKIRAVADIIPDLAAKTLRKYILGSTGNAGEAALEKLLEELQQTNTDSPEPTFGRSANCPQLPPNQRLMLHDG